MLNGLNRTEKQMVVGLSIGAGLAVVGGAGFVISEALEKPTPCYTFTEDKRTAFPFAEYALGDVEVTYNDGSAQFWSSNTDTELPGTITLEDGEYTLTVASLPEDADLYGTDTHVLGAKVAFVSPDMGAIGLNDSCEIERTTNEFGIDIAKIQLPVTSAQATS